jgi:uncharacterized membrane protein
MFSKPIILVVVLVLVIEKKNSRTRTKDDYDEFPNPPQQIWKVGIVSQ